MQEDEAAVARALEALRRGGAGLELPAHVGRLCLVREFLVEEADERGAAASRLSTRTCCRSPERSVRMSAAATAPAAIAAAAASSA